jgi:hypothetical protein
MSHHIHPWLLSTDSIYFRYVKDTNFAQDKQLFESLPNINGPMPEQKKPKKPEPREKTPKKADPLRKMPNSETRENIQRQSPSLLRWKGQEFIPASAAAAASGARQMKKGKAKENRVRWSDRAGVDTFNATLGN